MSAWPAIHVPVASGDDLLDFKTSVALSTTVCASQSSKRKSSRDILLKFRPKGEGKRLKTVVRSLVPLPTRFLLHVSRTKPGLHVN